MRRRRAALICPFAVLIAVSILAFKQQHASLPTVGLADRVPEAGSSPATPNRPVFVIVLVTTQGREDIVRSGRPWRKDVPTYIFTNNNSTVSSAEAAAHGERWLSYPDNDVKYTWKAGDFRAAVAPFLTYELIGPTFDWLLYGDDDTMFFAHGTIKLLREFDAGLPYLISDWLWAHNWDATLRNMSPRCLPCHAQHLSNCTGQLQRAHFQPPVGCPCTPQLLCAALREDEDVTIQEFVRGMCVGDVSKAAFQYPETWERVYSIHGGAGSAMSVTLLEAVTAEQMEACALKLCTARRQTGGDGILTTCLWEAGFSITDPGDAVCAEDWGPNKLFGGGEYSSGTMIKAWLQDALNTTSSKPCHLAGCEFQEAYLQRMVSTHLGANSVFSNLTELSACMDDIAAQYSQLMLSSGLIFGFGT